MAIFITKFDKHSGESDCKRTVGVGRWFDSRSAIKSPSEFLFTEINREGGPIRIPHYKSTSTRL